MKIILTFLIIVCSFQSFCQIVVQQNIPDVNYDYQAIQIDAFSQLNLSSTSIPSGFLMEYSMVGFEHAKLDGIANDPPISHIDDFAMVYASLAYGKVNTNSILADYSQLESTAHSLYQADGTIAIFMLDKKYHRFKDDALEQGLIQVSPSGLRFQAVSTLPSSASYPFTEDRVFSMAVFENSIKSHDALKFRLPANGLQRDFSGNLQIDFGDGLGYRSLNVNTTYTVNYVSSGTKTIRITDGTRITSTSIAYTRPDVFRQVSYKLMGSAGTAFEGTTARYEADVYLGCGGKLDKPVIILEGFDVLGDKTTGKLFEDFSDNKEIGLTTNLYQSLYHLGYDLIFVNLPDNNTYIQGNALALEALLKRIHTLAMAEPGSTITNTSANYMHLIGLSMGGLVSRWCLKDMEQRSVKHYVKNYFSYDAPHQGASIALGMQSAFAGMAKYFPPMVTGNFATTLKAFNSPAAKQMILYHFNINTGSVNNPLRASFASALKAKGYPAQSNNYGIALGRGDGVGYPTPSYYGQQMLYAKLGLLLARLEVEAFVQPAPGQPATKGSRVYVRLGHPFLPGYLVDSNWYFSSEFPNEVSPGGTRDIQRNIAEGIAEGGPLCSGLNICLFNEGENFDRPSSTFVPTVSALDLTNQQYGVNNKWFSHNQYFNISGQSNPSSFSPFHEVFVANQSLAENQPIGNYHHVSTQQNIVNFIVKRITGADPTVECNSFCNTQPTISGFTTLCFGNEYTYNVSNLPQPSGLSFNWSVNSALTIVSGQGTPNLKVKVVSPSHYGDAIISLSISKPSCSQPINLSLNNIWIGSPPPAHQSIVYVNGFYGQNPITLVNGGIYDFYYQTINGADSYQWEVPAGFSIQSGQGTSLAKIKTGPTNGTYVIKCFPTNSCGTYGYQSLYVTLSSASGGGGGGPGGCAEPPCIVPQPLRVSPNPANSSLDISSDELTSSNENSEIEYSLYNYQQSMVVQFKSKERNVRIATSSLPEGYYILHIVGDKINERRRIQIVH